MQQLHLLLLMLLLLTGALASHAESQRIHRLSTVPVASYDVGDTAKLSCQLGDSHPKPQITWQLSTGKLPAKSRTESGQSVLVIPGLAVEDSGLYSCVASNILGTVIASVRIIVKERSEQPRVIRRRVAAAPAALNVTLDCVPDGGRVLPVVAVWSRESGPLPDGRHMTLTNNSLRLLRLRSDDAGAYYCDAAFQTGERMTILYDLQVHRLIPSFRNPAVASHQSPAYIRLHHVSLPYLRHDVQVSFRARRGQGLILYSGTGRPGTDFLSLSLVDSHLVYRFNLGSGSLLLRSPTRVELNRWTTVGLWRAGRAGRLTVDSMAPVETATPGDRQGLGLPPVFYLGCAPQELLSGIVIQLGAAAAGGVCFDGDVSRVAVDGRPILVGDNAAAAAAVAVASGEAARGRVEQASVCGGGGVCDNGGECRPEHEVNGFRCHCTAEFTGPRCERRRELCSPAACGRHGRCREVADGIRCACPLGKFGDRCQLGEAISVPHFHGNGSYVALETRPSHSGNLVAMTIRPDDSTGSGLLMFTGGSGGDFQSLSLRNGRLQALLRISGRLHEIQTGAAVPAQAWTRVEFRRSLASLSLRLNQSEPATLSLPANGSRPLLSGPLHLGGVGEDFVANVSGAFAELDGVGGFRGCLRDLALMSAGVDLGSMAPAAVGHVADCAGVHGCGARLCEGGADCRQEVGVRAGFACACPEGRFGRFCERPLGPCERTVCLNAGQCRSATEDRRRHSCQCRVGFSGVHCQTAKAVHQSVRFHGDGYIELPGAFLQSAAGRQPQFQIEFSLLTNSSEGLVLWHGQPADELPDGQDLIAVSVRRGRLRITCRLAGQSVSLDSQNRVDDGTGRRIRVARKGDGLSMFVDSRLDAQVTSSPTLGLGQPRTRGSVYIGGVPGDSALSTGLHEAVDGASHFRGCLWTLRMQISAPVNFMAESLSGFNAVAC